MSHKLLLGLTMPVAVALLALVAVLLAVARVLVGLRRPAPVRLPLSHGDAPYKVEAQAGSDPARR